MFRVQSLIRNAFCELLALGIITSGRVRRRIDDTLSAGVITSIYFHKPNRRLFSKCIEWLVDHGYTFISANDLIDILYHGKPIPKGAVWLSLDDGYKEWIDDVLPLIRQHRVPVTLFIPSGIVEDGGMFPWLHDRPSHDLDDIDSLAHGAGRDAVTVSELKRISRYPEVTIGGHTVNHTVTVNLSEERTRFELGESKRILESWTGAPVQCFAYPVGLYDGHEKRALKEFGYRIAATTEDAFITRETDPYRIPRLCVSDDISFPEAICNMVGVWRPVLTPFKNFYHRLIRTTGPVLAGCNKRDRTSLAWFHQSKDSSPTKGT